MNEREVRRQYALFFLLVVGVVAGGFALARRAQRPSGTLSALSAVPADAWLVATIDAAALRASPLSRPLLGSPGAADGGAGVAATVIPGLGPVTDACGFDPLLRLDQVVVCAPEGGERGDFGVAFTGDLSRDDLAQCADRIGRARGGAPKTVTRGAFTILENEEQTRFAYRQGGPFLVGRGAWLDAMIDAVESAPTEERPEHAALRQALARAGAQSQGGRDRAVVVTALLPKSLRERLRAEFGAELGNGGGQADDERAYSGILAVASAGLALGTGGPGSTTELAVELRCDPDPATACADVKALVERKRMVLSRDLGLRLVGLGPLLDSLAVRVTGASLSATAAAPTDDLGRALERALAFRSPRRPPPPSPARSGAAASPPSAAAAAPPATPPAAASLTPSVTSPLTAPLDPPLTPPTPRTP